MTDLIWIKIAIIRNKTGKYGIGWWDCSLMPLKIKVVKYTERETTSYAVKINAKPHRSRTLPKVDKLSFEEKIPRMR